MRIVCARVRDAPLQALSRRDPELARGCVAVVDSAGAHGRVLACTPAAHARGVAPGQTVVQAQALVPSLLVRLHDPGAVAAARAALFDAAASVAPRVEPEADRVYAEITGLGGLYGGSDAGLVAALSRAAERVGLAVDVGVADTRSAARVACSRRVCDGVRGPLGGAIVPRGGTAAFLAPLPLDVLPLSSGLRLELARLGVRTVGALAALPRRATATRLGPEVARAIVMARGADRTPLFPRPHATRFEESLALEWEVREAEALLFVLKRLCDALVARLACRALAAAGVGLSLRLASGGGARDERTVALAAPTRDAAALLHLLRASLEGRPPPDAVTGVVLTAVAAAPRPAQLGLFDPPAPAPERLALVLARLAVLVGEGRVGAPVVPDTHRPHAVAVAPFAPPAAPPRDLTAPGEPAADARGGGEPAAEPGAIALHVLRPPRAAEVVLAGGRMARVHAGEIAGSVRACCGPFRVAGEWWGEPFDHDGYDVELDDGGLYLVAFDHLAHAWRVEGVYE